MKHPTSPTAITFQRRALMALVVGAAWTTTPSFGAGADTYPDRPIRIIVPYAAGGGGDFVVRAWSDKLSAVLKQPVVVDNRGGGNTVAGTDAVAKAAPDGYTLLLTSPIFATMPVLTPNLPYRTPEDFAPVALVMTYAFGLAARSSLPAQNIQQLVEYARANPRKVSVATSGEGSSSQAAAKLFESAAGIQLLEVPYKGAGPAMLDVASGTVDLAFTGLAPVQPHLQSKRVKLLATTGLKRLQSAPAVPTIAEQGVNNFEAKAWWGMLAPAGTPKDIIAKLNAALKVALADPAVGKRLEVVDGEAGVSTPEQFEQIINDELSRWKKLLKPQAPAARP